MKSKSKKTRSIQVYASPTKYEVCYYRNVFGIYCHANDVIIRKKREFHVNNLSNKLEPGS